MSKNTVTVVLGVVILIIAVSVVYYLAQPPVTAPIVPVVTGQVPVPEVLVPAPATSTVMDTPAPSAQSSASSSAPLTSINYTLHVGQIISVSGVTITVLSVEDSRCPVDATCIQAGTVSVTLKLQKGNISTDQIITFGLPVTEAGLTTELTGASPAKHVGKAIAQKDYVLAFRITAQ